MRSRIVSTRLAPLTPAVERLSPVQVPNPHFDVASALINLNNPSYQSINRPKIIDVTDLREALGSHATANSTSPSIISTNGGRSVDEQPKKRFAQQDVKEVLKDIFKDKKKHQSKALSMEGVPGKDSVPIVLGERA
jgi:hypothetical protein